MTATARRCRICLALGLAGTVGLAAGPAQSQSSTPQERALGQLNTDVAFSLFLLSNGAFGNLGHFKFSDEDLAAKLNTYSLPLRTTIDTGLIGPLELRASLGYGEATTIMPKPVNQAEERQYFSLWNLAFDIGRPIALTPGLFLTPSLGIGTQHWSGKLTSRDTGSARGVSERLTFSTDALLLSAAAMLEYRYKWGDVNIRPGAVVSYVDLSPISGSANMSSSASPLSQRGKASIEAQSTVLRSGLSIDGPLGVSLLTLDLRWQTFLVGNYSTTNVGLFRWTVELGAAVGADFAPIGRRTLGFNPGELFLGASYIVGENLSGVRGNLGFRF